MAINTTIVDSIISGLEAMPKKSEIDTITNNIDKVVDTENDGLMSVSDKAELDKASKILKNIDSDSPVFYTHPTTAGNKHIPSGGSSGQILKWSANGTAKWENEKTYDVVDTENDGLMSVADKTNLDAAVAKLNGIANGANKYTLPTASKDKLGGVTTTSNVTSIEGLNPCPIIDGVPYYKDTFNEYNLPTASSTTLGGVWTASSVTSTAGLTACPIIAGVPYYKGVTIDSETSTTSTNPLQNNVITSTFALKSKYGDSTINVGRKTDSTVGTYSTAEGDSTEASGDYSHAEGYQTTASGNYSHAESRSSNNISSVITDFSSETINDDIITAWNTTKFSLARGDSSHVEGRDTLALGNYSHAEGRNTIASGGLSHAEGYNTIAIGTESHAEGYLTVASGNRSHAEGGATTASGSYSHAEGRSAYALSSVITDFSSETTNADIITAWTAKKFSLAKGQSSHVEGGSTLALGLESHAEGGATTASGSYSHAEGGGTTASGSNSHAEGDRTTASGYASHAEGFQTISNGICSHAEGGNIELSMRPGPSWNCTINETEYEITSTTATGICSHGEGGAVFAYGRYSHAEGYHTLSSENCSHAEGDLTVASGNRSHAEGWNTTASGDHSHAEGAGTTASGGASHAEGANTTASGLYSHAEGWKTTASGSPSHAEGNYTTASGSYSHAEGNYTKADGDYSHAEGEHATASGLYSHAEGYYTKADGDYSHAEGASTTASGSRSHAEGWNTTASGDHSHAEGFINVADNYASHAGGHYNAAMTTGGNYNNTTGTAFVIGNGTASDALSNAFSVQFDGTVKAKSTITASTTADYAEFFEWLDSNPDNEDRVGYFVTLDGDKIRVATDEDDYILGVVSGEPFVLGNGDCDTWNGMYLHDEFRRTIYEPAPKVIMNNDGEYKEIEGEYEGTRPKLNPDYDHTQKYISRFDRKEWSPVGMLGVLAVRHDGTAKVNGYVTVNKNGIATACSKSTENSYRVIKSNSDLVVEIIFR